MNTNMKIMMHANSCNCAACAPIPTLGIEMPYGIKENCLAVACPKAATMLSEKDKHFAFEITAGSKKKLTFVCPNCEQKFEATVKEVVRSVNEKGNTGCPVCANKKVVPGINDLATTASKVAAMLSDNDKHFAFKITAGSGQKLTFVCPSCKLKFEATVKNVVRSVNKGLTGCPVCARQTIVPGFNDLASKYPEIAAMWSSRNKLSASEVAVKSGKKAVFVCSNCGQEFKAQIYKVVCSLTNGNTGCPICAGKKVVPGINDLASQYPKIAAMWSPKNKHFASEFTVGSYKKAIFKCPDCKKEFKSAIASVVRSMKIGCTGCYNCNMRKLNAMHKKMLPTSTNTRCTLCGCTTRRSIFWKKARLSLTETRNARNCWRFATASTCVKTGRTHQNSLSLLMHSKRDFSMM